MNYSFYDEMDELDDILNESTDEEIFIESMEELFEEKASQLEYNIRRFKEKYNFNPKDSTIIVDGHKYKVDMRFNDPISYIKGVGASENLGTSAKIDGGSIDTTPITLSKSFFMLKDDSRRAAVLQHEIGHLKLHSKNPKNPHTDKKTISRNLSTTDSKYYVRYRTQKLRREDPSINKQEIRHTLKDDPSVQKRLKNNKELAAQSSATKSEEAERDKLRKRATELSSTKNPLAGKHLNPVEIEADRYAANKVGERPLKRALRESYKKGRSDKPMVLEDKNAIRKTVCNINKKRNDIDPFAPLGSERNDDQLDMNDEKQTRNAIGKKYRENMEDVKDARRKNQEAYSKMTDAEKKEYNTKQNKRRDNYDKKVKKLHSEQ